MGLPPFLLAAPDFALHHRNCSMLQNYNPLLDQWIPSKLKEAEAWLQSPPSLDALCGACANVFSYRSLASTLFPQSFHDEILSLVEPMLRPFIDEEAVEA